MIYDYPNFIHLRNHSGYSLSEGAIKVDSLINKCVGFGMPACALTDINNVYGALEFTQKCFKSGIQPIIGVEINVYFDKVSEFSKVNLYKIVILAKNNYGISSLMDIVSSLYVDAEDLYCAISFEKLQKLANDLIFLSGGEEGFLHDYIKSARNIDLNDIIHKFRNIKNCEFYCELNRYDGYDSQLEEIIIDYCYDQDIPLVATNNVFFEVAEDHVAHDCLICIKDSMRIDDDRRKKSNPDFYFKSSEQMIELFADIPEAIENTVNIALSCSSCIETKDPILPSFVDDENISEAELFKSESIKGLESRKTEIEDYSDEKFKLYQERLEFEMDIIINMGFTGYFLIVMDFIQWAKNNNIPVGPGRGSGAGSLVAWSMKITNIDPIRYGLFFERFLNPERKSMPDFDIDFCQDRRGEVIDYVQQRYGKERVAQIITFGTFKAKMVIRDVGRVLGISYGKINDLAKFIPNNPMLNIKLKDVLVDIEQIKREYNSDEEIRRLFDIALKLEGLYRHASIHAAGIVIAKDKIRKSIALYNDSNCEIPATQFNMKYVEQIGMVKFDFLGLKTLSIIQNTVDRVNNDVNTKDKIDPENISIYDNNTYKSLCDGDTVGVFQLESAGMTKALINLKPDTIEDIIATISLYRPGPMENIPSYINRKHGVEETLYMHPLLKDILEETYGIPVYQEQVMQMARVLSGYSLGEADLLRRAMGKKIPEEMKVQREKFIEGAYNNNNVDKELSNQIFEYMDAFAGYGFNKSHAAAYAIIAYQTAWLKTYYKEHFLCSILSYDKNNTEKIGHFINVSRAQGVNIYNPCVNCSDVNFKREYNDTETGIRYGLSALKSVGDAAAMDIIEERQKNGNFIDIFDFFERMSFYNLNKRTAEALAKSGSFDILNIKKEIVVSNIEKLLSFGSEKRENKNSGQGMLFDTIDDVNNGVELLPSDDFSLVEQSDNELEVFGFYYSSRPVDKYKNLFEQYQISTYKKVSSGKFFASIVNLCVSVNSIRKIKTKTNRDMMIIDVNDGDDAFSVVVFGEKVNHYQDIINSGEVIFMSCAIKIKEEEIDFFMNSCELMETWVSNRSNVCTVKVFENYNNMKDIVNKLLSLNKGKTEIKFEMILKDEQLNVDLKVELPTKSMKFEIDEKTVSEIKKIKGVYDATYVPSLDNKLIN